MTPDPDIETDVAWMDPMRFVPQTVVEGYMQQEYRDLRTRLTTAERERDEVQRSFDSLRKDFERVVAERDRAEFQAGEPLDYQALRRERDEAAELYRDLCEATGMLPTQPEEPTP